jgi:hypothetical protein
VEASVKVPDRPPQRGHAEPERHRPWSIPPRKGNGASNAGAVKQTTGVSSSAMRNGKGEVSAARLGPPPTLRGASSSAHGRREPERDVIPMMNWIVGFIGGIATGVSIIALAALWRESQGRRLRNLTTYRARIRGLVAQHQGRCDICGATTEQHRKERCRGVCGKEERHGR